MKALSLIKESLIKSIMSTVNETVILLNPYINKTIENIASKDVIALLAFFVS
jgi:hypothetical protein